MPWCSDLRYIILDLAILQFISNSYPIHIKFTVRTWVEVDYWNPLESTGYQFDSFVAEVIDPLQIVLGNDSLYHTKHLTSSFVGISIINFIVSAEEFATISPISSLFLAHKSTVGPSPSVVPHPEGRGWCALAQRQPGDCDRSSPTICLRIG